MKHRCRLIDYAQVVPGGYRFEDLNRGSHKFGPSPSITDLATEVSSFRTANKIARASYEECLTDISRWQCTRLGCDPLWCVPIEPEVIHSEAMVRRKPCSGCGAVAH